MKTNPLKRLNELGQSVWLDLLSRDLTRSGKLKNLIENDGLSGETSNPTIFEKAIAGSHDYDEDIKRLAREGNPKDKIYEAIVIGDIREAADLFRPVYDETGGADGFVSIEVSPSLARDTEATIREAHRLWDEVSRPNIMVKIPATREGIPAIRQCTEDGLNINVTLLFGLDRYREVADAYLAGIEERVSKGLPVDTISSVASFFLSRIDVLLDPQFEDMIKSGGDRAENAAFLRGKTAIAQAKIAYRMYRETFHGLRFAYLESRRVRPQRLLWASTGTKNPQYSDVKYVEPLVGRETVNTLPPETLEAFRDHGSAELRIENGTDEAEKILAMLPDCGIDIDEVTEKLEANGIRKFLDSFAGLEKAVDKVLTEH